jgi:DNA-binding CsgD family transcriptional regulator
VGYTELVLGNHDRATGLLEEALALSEELGDRLSVAYGLMGLGIAARLRDDPKREKELLNQSLAILVEVQGSKVIIAEDLEALAEAAGALGQHLRAARLWGAAGAVREDLDVPWQPAERMLHEPQLIAAQSRIDEATWETGFAEGRAMALEKAVEYALSEEEPAPSPATEPERSPPIEPIGNLTRREREVACLVARGLTNRHIASELFLSERTIENHVSKILRKLELASRTEIAAWATQHRLLAPNPD